jgi:hypothetical protein
MRDNIALCVFHSDALESDSSAEMNSTGDEKEKEKEKEEEEVVGGIKIRVDWMTLPSDLTTTEFGFGLNNFMDRNPWKGVFYANEELNVDCCAPTFTFNGKTAIIQAITKNGMRLNIGNY